MVFCKSCKPRSMLGRRKKSEKRKFYKIFTSIGGYNKKNRYLCGAFEKNVSFPTSKILMLRMWCNW